MKSYVIVLCGGKGERMGAGINKVYLPIAGIPAVIRSLAPFTGYCRGAVVVTPQNEIEQMKSLLAVYGLDGFVHQVVAGGETRQASVWNGLCALPEGTECVLIHDGARALISEPVIERVLSGIREHGNASAAIRVTDTISRAMKNGQIIDTPDRAELYAMQTPQGFLTGEIREAHLLAKKDGFVGTDDASLLRHSGKEVFVCEGSRYNLKLTTAEDLAIAEALLRFRKEGAEKA